MVLKVSPEQLAWGSKWVSRGQNIEPDYQDTWRKSHQSYTVRCPQKMMKNITSFHPTCSEFPQKKGGKKGDDWQFLYSVEGGRIKDCEKMRREWERLSQRAVGQITDVCGVHTDFMKLISKQQLEEKARQRHTRTAAEREKGNEKCNLRNREGAHQQPPVHVCVCVCVLPCIYSYTAQHTPALCLFNFKGNFLQ